MFKKYRPQILAHAREEAPNECLGGIVGDEYVRLTNASIEPEKTFLMTPTDERKYGLAPGQKKDKPSALVHSHPDGPLYPSLKDQELQVRLGIPMVIVARGPRGWDYWEMGDHMLSLPLVGREFRHAVTDCKEAIRSWYHQEFGVYLPFIPRRNDWWAPVHEVEGDESSPILREPDNLYADNFEKWGFYQLPNDEKLQLQRGDVFFYRLHMGNSAVRARQLETHGGVYLGNGEIYHHLPGRLSTIEAADGWARRASRWVRYGGTGEPDRTA